jgi:adenine-specific DNA glycosylase
MRDATEQRQAEALAQWWQGRRNVRRLPWRLATEPLARRAMVEGLLAQTSAAMVASHYARVFEGVHGYLDWLNLRRVDQVARVQPLGLPRLKADAVTGIASWGASPQPMLHVGALSQFQGIGPYTEAMVLTLHGAEAVPVDTNVQRVGRRASCDGDAERWMAAVLGFAEACPPLQGDERNPPIYQLTSAVLDLGAGPCDIDAPDCERCPLYEWLCPTAARRAVQRCLPCERYSDDGHGPPPKPA